MQKDKLLSTKKRRNAQEQSAALGQEKLNQSQCITQNIRLTDPICCRVKDETELENHYCNFYNLQLFTDATKLILCQWNKKNTVGEKKRDYKEKSLFKARLAVQRLLKMSLSHYS